jgi:hypothetical protein
VELYHVTTLAKKYDGCKDVEFIWIHDGRRAPRPYADLIENYDPSDRYAEGYIDELFELDEAQALKDYIDQNHGEDTTTTIEKAKLPIANGATGARAMAVGGGNGFHMLPQGAELFLAVQGRGVFRPSRL